MVPEMRLRRGYAFTGWVLLTLLPSICAGQAAPTLGLLHSAEGSTDRKLASEVDSALRDALAKDAGIHDVTVSPANYEALLLAVGCEGESRTCLASIAEMLQTEAVLVSRLRVDATGLTSIDLYYFAPEQRGEVPAAHATVAAGASPSIAESVPRLVRQLFGLNERSGSGGPGAEPVATGAAQAAPAHVESPTGQTAPTASTVEYDEPERTEGSARRTWAWVALVSGAAVLGAGIGVGISANAKFDTLKQTDPKTAEDAAQIHEDFDALGGQATAANVLMPVGGAILAVGAVLLAIDLADSSEAHARNPSRLALQPLRGGALVTLSRSIEGM